MKYTERNAVKDFERAIFQRLRKFPNCEATKDTLLLIRGYELNACGAKGVCYRKAYSDIFLHLNGDYEALGRIARCLIQDGVFADDIKRDLRDVHCYKHTINGIFKLFGSRVDQQCTGAGLVRFKKRVNNLIEKLKSFEADVPF
ncbi:MAG: hypothetical protein GY765_33255 [bacterium]|nr:hypothetical protein [bacterium]